MNRTSFNSRPPSATIVQQSLGLCTLLAAILSSCGCASLLVSGQPPNSSQLTLEQLSNSESTLAPNVDAAQVCLATADEMFSSGRFEHALQLYSKAASLSPELAEQIAPKKARLLGEFGSFHAAKKEFESAIARDPNNSELLNDFGYLLLENEAYEAATTTLSKAVELAPANQRARVNLGVAYASTNRIDEAFDAFEPAVGEAAALANIGSVLARKGTDIELAKEYLEEALQIDPHMPQPAAILAYLEAAPKE